VIAEKACYLDGRALLERDETRQHFATTWPPIDVVSKEDEKRERQRLGASNICGEFGYHLVQ
jgi:hypothetical protein